MLFSCSDINGFMRLFRGHAAGYGCTELGEMVDGKVEVNCRVKYDPNVPYAAHIEGKLSVGIAPLCENNTCIFGALDIDNYDYDLMDIVRAIYEYNIPLVPCWSKSKKLHLYLFCPETPATDVINVLTMYRDFFACGSRTEIFPKQANMSDSTKFPSWINIPYFDATNPENHRKMIKADGSLADLDTFVERAEECKIDIKGHKKVISSLWFSDAPPCVQTGILLHDVPKGGRNNWMFNVGVYVRLRDDNDDYESILKDVNSGLHNPISENELESTVIKGLHKNTYFYICNDMYRCDKNICKKREYGISCKESSGLSYGEMRQIMTTPPTYEWDVNGITISFENEQEIMGQTKFRAMCMRHLHIMPRRIKDDAWSSIITRAMENIVVVQPSDGGEYYDEGSIFESILLAFLRQSVPSEDMQSISRGNIVSPGDGYLYFDPAWFIQFFYDRKALRLPAYDVYKYLYKYGCEQVSKGILRYKIADGNEVHTIEGLARRRAEQEDAYYNV